ncbi:hypothetical protein RND71_042003 [Anisodus tanguticus]|uniref:DUF4283 domain-containing protein n=1 Tax=Anisodus tanguticus TaxID=243964 RepID=A0AAE1QQM1_9SOLA|nr:hypothetical protein RND71_042003 [Anisodus tanguticus]
MAIPAFGGLLSEVGHHPPILRTLSTTPTSSNHPPPSRFCHPRSAINGGTSSPCGNASPMSSSIPIKPIVYLHGEPFVRFEKKEVEVMIHQQNLNLAVIGKFSHGWPEIGLLRTAIPKQCGLKAEVNIGLLCDRHVLIRCTIAEDYDTLMSRQTFEIKEKNKPYLMRTFKWDVTFNPDEETRFAYGWISFPGLPPHFHGESSLFSMAASVGIPISIDSATRNKTRPSSARVKVEVDLLKVHPKSVLIQVGEGRKLHLHNKRLDMISCPNIVPIASYKDMTQLDVGNSIGIETKQGESGGGKRFDGGGEGEKGVVLVQCTQPLAGETIHKDAITVFLSPYDSQDILHHQTFGGSTVYTAWWKSESFRLRGPHISVPFEGVRVRGAHTVHHWWEFEVFRLGGPHTYSQISMGSRLRGSAHTVHHWWESKEIRLGGPHIYLIGEGVRGRDTRTAHHGGNSRVSDLKDHISIGLTCLRERSQRLYSRRGTHGYTMVDSRDWRTTTLIAMEIQG